MNISQTPPAESRLRICKHVWPLPVALALFALMGLARLMGEDVFLATHFIFEIGITVCMLASVVYTVRLWRIGTNGIPRWVFFLNLFFGPLIFAAQLIASFCHAPK